MTFLPPDLRLSFRNCLRQPSFSHGQRSTFHSPQSQGDSVHFRGNTNVPPTVQDRLKKLFPDPDDQLSPNVAIADVNRMANPGMKTYRDFEAVMAGMPDAEAYLVILERLSEAFVLGNNVISAFLKSVETGDLPAFEKEANLLLAFKDAGLFHRNDPSVVFQERCMMLLGALSRDPDISTDFLMALPEKLKVLVTQPETDPSSTPVLDIRGVFLVFLGRTLDFYQASQLFKKMGSSIQRKPFTDLSFDAYMDKILSAVVPLKNKMILWPEGLSMATRVFDRSRRSLEDFLVGMNLTTMAFEDTQKHPELQDVVYRLANAIEDPDALNYTANLAKKCVKNGVSPAFMLKLFQPKSQAAMLVTDPYTRPCFSGLPDILKNYQSPEAQTLFLKILHTMCVPEEVQKGSTAFMPRVAQMIDAYLSLPEEMSEETRLALSQRFVEDKDTHEKWKTYKTLMKPILSGIGDDLEISKLVLDTLFNTKNIALSGFYKACLLTDKHARMGKTPLSNAMEYIRIPDLLDRFKDENFTEKDYREASHALLKLAKEVQDPSPNLQTALESALDMTGRKRFPLSQIDVLVEKLYGLTSNLPVQVAHSLLTTVLYRLRTGIPAELYKEPVLLVRETFRVMDQVSDVLEIAAPGARDEIQPEVLGFLLDKVLKELPIDRWKTMLEDLIPVLAKTPRAEQRDFYRNDCQARNIFERVIQAGFQKDPEYDLKQMAESAYEIRRDLVRRFESFDLESLLLRLLEASSSAKTLDASYDLVKKFVSNLSGPEEKADTLQKLVEILHTVQRQKSKGPRKLPPKSSAAKIKKIMTPSLSFIQQGGDGITLLRILSDVRLKNMSDLQTAEFLRYSLPPIQKLWNKVLLAEYAEMIEPLYSYYQHQPELFGIALELITRLPDRWQDHALAMGNVEQLRAEQALDEDSDDDDNKVAPTRDPETFRRNMQLFAALGNPNQLLNYYMLNRQNLDPEILYQLYYLVEYADEAGFGYDIVPEMMAMLKPYADYSRTRKGSAYNEHLSQATGAITMVYDYINGSGMPGAISETAAINEVSGRVYKNWARVGTLGLSFPKWQYDSMKLWKGLGPSEKQPLMVQSGLFRALPPRESDKTYHGGFYHFNPETGVSVEMRRAYIAISKPMLGTLVIRNSSQVFGRELMEEPAYFNPDTVLTQPPNLFDPENPEGFESVLGKKINQTQVQEVNNVKIEKLLDAYEAVMDQYATWKCGFKEGKAPAGFREMLRTSLTSAQNDGATTPFGKKKNIKLAWVNPYELPFAVSSFDVTNPQHQKEMTQYLNILDKRTTVLNETGYENTMPSLLAFLKDGLSKNLELVLTE